MLTIYDRYVQARSLNKNIVVHDSLQSANMESSEFTLSLQKWPMSYSVNRPHYVPF